MIYDENTNQEQNHPNNIEPNGEKPYGYKVEEDDNNLEEKDLKRTYLFGGSEVADANQPGMEGEGYGGQSFGQSSVTTSGDDPANPSRNAGYDNGYFKRTEPSEEHPENSNFKPGDQPTQPSNDNFTQEGTADYDGGTISGGQGHETPAQLNASTDQADEANNVQHKIGAQNQTEPGKAEFMNNYDSDNDYDNNDGLEPRDHIET